MWFSKGTSILIETLVQPQTNRVKEQKHCIFIKNGLSLCWVTGQLMSLLSSVYSKRCFPDQDRLLGVLTGQENIFLPSASLFSFRPPSIQEDVFYDQEMVNRPQWITTSEADTDSRLSVPGWSRVLNGPSLTMEVNIYPKKYQYPGSETVWYKNVWQMDFYSPLIPSGGLNAEPMVNAAYEELFEARLGIATSNSMCLSLGKESCKSGRFFWWG